jgi:O-acetyl-ADP-ribose deacetylase (regulator of RNase III)
VGINYILGDATKPIETNTQKIIVHVVSNKNKFGAGFVVALSRRWKSPEYKYREWANRKHSEHPPFELGQVQFVQVDDDLYVANLLGQEGIYPVNGIPPIRYRAVQDGLQKVCNKAQELGASVHMPRIGCGLAGGTWNRIAEIILNELVSNHIPVYVYTLEHERDKYTNEFSV